MTNNNKMLLVSLTESDDKFDDDDSGDDQNLVKLIGGKAASLMRLHSIPELSGHVPRGYVLTTEFFDSWINQVCSSGPYSIALQAIQHSTTTTATTSKSDNNHNHNHSVAELTKLCDVVKQYCRTKLNFGESQNNALSKLKHEKWNYGLVAVRSSAPEEDGSDMSYAGQFVTKLGVSPHTPYVLERAVIDCFASLFDYRVFSYAVHQQGGNNNDNTATDHRKPKFACVVMEMVDSEIAGVAFSQNPINNDLDEMVVDSSWGLGESVVDGSIVADRYVYAKLGNPGVIKHTVGSKKQEKRLLLGGTTSELLEAGRTNGGLVVTKQVDENRQKQRSLSDKQLRNLCHIVCIIEDSYQMPMDIEFAFTTTATTEDSGSSTMSGSPSSSTDDKHVIKLLQARPITTSYSLDKEMLTQPGEPRILYYDFNIISDATTTKPFTHLDMQLYRQMSSILMVGNGDLDLIPDITGCHNNDPKQSFAYSANTRQYFNLSIMFRWFAPGKFGGWSRMLDPYLASIFESSDCERNKYKAGQCPKNINIRNAIWWMRQYPLWTMYKRSKKYKSQPEQAKEEYIKIRDQCLERLGEVHRRGYNEEEGLQKYIEELVATLMPSIDEELALLMMVVLPIFKKLDAKRRDETKSEEERQEYEALCGGYEGDPLMEVNIAMYKLARLLPLSIWEEYDHFSYDKLAERIRNNLNGVIDDDIPIDFLTAWESFMKSHGYDGVPQLFVSSAKYIDHPELLLAMISHNVGDGIVDPASIQEMKVNKRREAMAVQEARAKRRWWWNSDNEPSVRNQNEILEHLMWIRNVPKMNWAQAMGMVREALLSVEAELLQSNRLEQPGDIFHLDIEGIDTAIMAKKNEDSSSTPDLMEFVRPRKAIYEKAMRATQCPLLVDSLNRFLRPDVTSADCEPGTLIGAAISPGLATGKVRIVHDPTDPFQTGEVLAAIVTDPAWTPMFVGAAAVILQIGGVLQHGALCAREYGKPGVSCINIRENLTTGMMVSVDGNTGVVKILEGEDNLSN